MKQNLSLFFGSLIGGGALVLLAYAAGQEWGVAAQVAAMAYAVLVTVFLAAQLAGFVLTQTVYVHSIERTKFKVLEVEGLLEGLEHEERHGS
jgi:hypothetical protein